MGTCVTNWCCELHVLLSAGWHWIEKCGRKAIRKYGVVINDCWQSVKEWAIINEVPAVRLCVIAHVYACVYVCLRLLYLCVYVHVCTCVCVCAPCQDGQSV